jgi:hypothetical protein
VIDMRATPRVVVQHIVPLRRRELCVTDRPKPPGQRSRLADGRPQPAPPATRAPGLERAGPEPFA